VTGLPVSAKDERSMDVAVRLFAIATQNVQVDQGTAANDVAIVCHHYVNDAIPNLIESDNSDRKSISVALTLCGLVLNVHTRCKFWLDEVKSWTSPRSFQIR
jgi:hypothetical protein